MRGLAVFLLPLGLAACGDGPAPLSNPAPVLPAFMVAEIEQGPGGRCFGRDISPAVIETVTAQEVAVPPVLGPDGAVLVPAVFQTVTRQVIVREREEVAFETLCPPAYTPDFVATLQRALAARGFYSGEVNGLLDEGLGRAVQAYQREDGPDSPLLSIVAGRRLGIVTLSEADLAALG
jgi:hypothetical protein